MHILIVEDDDGARRALVRILQGGGHTTCWSANAAGAFRLLGSEVIDAVLLDIDLGDGSPSGFDVARAMHSDPTWSTIPIIIVSGLDADDIREAASPPKRNALEGVDFIVSKPVEAEKLLHLLEHLKQV